MPKEIFKSNETDYRGKNSNYNIKQYYNFKNLTELRPDISIILRNVKD